MPSLLKMRVCRLPLPQECPDSISSLPEYIVEDMSTFVIFLAQHSCSIFEKGLPGPADLKLLEELSRGSLATDSANDNSQTRSVAVALPDSFCRFSSMWILRLFVYLLNSPSYVKNPYLRGKLAESLSAVAPFSTGHGLGCTRVGLLVSRDLFLVRTIIPAIVKLYIAIERTGASKTTYVDVVHHDWQECFHIACLNDAM